MSRQNTTESLLCHQDTYFQEGRAASEAIFENDTTAKPSTFIDFLSPNCREQVEISVVTEVQHKQPDHKLYVNYPYSSRNTKVDLLPHQRAAPVRDASVYFVNNSGYNNNYEGYQVQAVPAQVDEPVRNNSPFMPPPPPAESTYEVLVNTNGLSMDEANNHLIYLANTYIQKIHESNFYFTHELSSGKKMSVEDPCPADLSVFQYVTEWCHEAAQWWERNFNHMQRPVHVHVRPTHRRVESAEFVNKADFPTPTKRRTPAAFDPPRPRSQQQAMPSFKKSK